MSRRAITGILIAFAGLIVAGAGVFAVYQILTASIAPASVPTPVAQITEQVVITTRDISIGEVLQADDLTIADVPVELIPRDAERNIQEVEGKITKIQMVSGEIVLKHHLANPTNVSHDVAFIISDDLVLMAFPAQDLMSDLNVLQRGDLVDILVSIEEKITPVESDPEKLITGEETPSETKWFTFDAMQAIEISAIIADIKYQEEDRTTVSGTDINQEIQPTPQPSDVNVKAYLLAVTPQDALVLKNLIDIGGKFDIVLRAPTNIQFFDLDPVTLEYLVDKYELETTP